MLGPDGVVIAVTESAVPRVTEELPACEGIGFLVGGEVAEPGLAEGIPRKELIWDGWRMTPTY